MHFLWQLLKEEAVFERSHECQIDFKRLEGAISSWTTLAHYCPELAINVKVDVSSIVIGVVLQQEGQLVCYASKSPTEMEKQHTNLEREMLVVVFRCERICTYLYSWLLTVTMGHESLEMITQKPLSNAPAWLRHMLLRLVKYGVTV